jgi:hypothetical protein
VPLDPKTFIRIHKARMDGMSHYDIAQALEGAGVDPIPAMKEYALTKLPDGRLAGQVNPADPAEWTQQEAPNDRNRPGPANGGSR